MYPELNVMEATGMLTLGAYAFSDDVNLPSIDNSWEQDYYTMTLGITGLSAQEQQVQYIQTFSEPAPLYLQSYDDITGNFGLFSQYTTVNILLGYTEIDGNNQESIYQAYSPSLLYAHANNQTRWLANQLSNAVSYDDWINVLDNDDGDGFLLINTGDLEFPDSEGVPVSQVVIPAQTRTAPSIGWTQYSKNLHTCVPGTETFYVCNDSASPSYYITTGLDCEGNAIPADFLNGTIQANFVNQDCCTIECIATDIDMFAIPDDWPDNATYGQADGEFSVTLRDDDGDGYTDAGDPTTTGGSQFTVSLVSVEGNAITQTMPA